jgi:putative effector of murein hydrolase LrgA (UPF0299 family)
MDGDWGGKFGLTGAWVGPVITFDLAGSGFPVVLLWLALVEGVVAASQFEGCVHWMVRSLT